jgi:hypothetical protein
VKGRHKAGGSIGGKGNKKGWEEELESEENCMWKREKCTEMFI